MTRTVYGGGGGGGGGDHPDSDHATLATETYVDDADTSHEGALDPHPGYVQDSEVGAANGVAPLGSDGKVPGANLPAGESFTIVEVADETARLALPEISAPYMAIQDGTPKTTWLLNADEDPSVSGNWIEGGGQAVTSVGDGTTQKTGTVDLSDLFAAVTSDGEGGYEWDLTQKPAEVLTFSEADDRYAGRTGNAVADTITAVGTTANTFEVDFAGPAIQHLELDENVTTVTVANAPASGTLGIVEWWIHQPSAGSTFSVTLSEIEALADEWGPDGPPDAIPQSNNAIVVIRLRSDEGTVYGSWSKPDVRFVPLLGSDPAASTDPSTGNGKVFFVVPAPLNGYSLLAVRGDLGTAGTTASTMMIRRNRGGTDADMLSTAITVDANETSTDSAATPAVINTSNDDLVTGDRIFLDLDGVGTASRGHLATLTLMSPAL